MKWAERIILSLVPKVLSLVLNDSISILWAHIRLYFISLVQYHSEDTKIEYRAFYELSEATNTLLYYPNKTQGVYKYKNGLFYFAMHIALSLVALGFGAILCYVLFIILGIYLNLCISHRRLYNTLISHRRPPRLW